MMTDREKQLTEQLATMTKERDNAREQVAQLEEGLRRLPGAFLRQSLEDKG